ncbi:hypothetical protein [Segniliparus rugosus]|uniref:Lipoprotein n=1 Tax=Segniliparus rugosus (strain ATCC BAA-974 / DSM 45345 / CCUG 50838 / CIP 108380 / JCM 13579 / CDC 945) TaxID=679197 RepID=E5XQ57_SEGRC|nr:hypothetical protein [Segniliparus rugosus]EFV13516.2 hypothetical protein HMPREF9336_01629 [Segniliparus rugosus ATCC BAA-974]
MTPAQRGAPAALAALLLAAACSPGPAPDPAASPEAPAGEYLPPPAFARHSFVWSAAAGVDLASGAAVPARALVESAILVVFARDRRSAYPGAERAYPSLAVAARSNELLGWRGAPTSDYRGTDYLKIMSVLERGDGIEVSVCWEHSHTAQLGPGEGAEGGYFQGLGMYAERVDFEKPEPAGGPAAAQRGPRQAPSGNVFGAWRAKRLLVDGPAFNGWRAEARAGSALADREADEQDAQTQRCKDESGLPSRPVENLGARTVGPDEPWLAPSPPEPGWPG